MRTFQQVIAAFITLIAILLLPFALFGFQIGQILFTPQAMLNLIVDQVIIPAQTNFLADTLLQSLPQQLGLENDSTLGKALTAAGQQTAIQDALFPTELQVEYTAQGLNSFYVWLDGPDPMPTFELDMQPLKTHLLVNAQGLVNNVLGQIPACTAEESLSLATTLLGAVLGGEPLLETLPTCIPPIVPVETLAPAAGELLKQQLTIIPETVVLTNLVSATPQRMQEIKGSLQLAKGALQWGWLPLAFLLLIGAFIGGQTQAGVPLWLGLSLLATSVWTFLFTLIPTNFWLAAVVPQFAGWPLFLQIPVAAMLAPLLAQAGQSTVWLAVALLVIGLLLLILAIFLRRRSPKSLTYLT